MSSSRGNFLVVISGPSGAGKSSVYDKALSIGLKLIPSISYTTRSKRHSEVDGREYHFVSKAQFLEMLDKGDFIEHTSIYGNYYGTSKTQLSQLMISGNDVILDLDVVGGQNIKKLFSDPVLIFILPPSFASLKKRLVGRNTNDVSDIQTRLSNLRKELEYIKNYDYVIINDRIDDCVARVLNIIEAERCRRTRNISAVERFVSSIQNEE